MEQNNIKTTQLSSGIKMYQNKDSNIKTDKVNIKSSYDTVSVIMTFYNAQEFIQQALNSVLTQFTGGEGQAHFKIEFIIVDDKSKDQSRQIVDAMVKQFNETVYNDSNFDTHVKVIEPEHNLGCGGARKFGIEHASGDYIMFLDADDYYINHDFVSRAYDTIRKTNADIIEYGMRMNMGDGNVQNIVAPQQMAIKDNPSLAEHALFRDNLIKFNVWTKIYKKSVINSHQYSDSRTFEDVRTVPYWLKNASTIIIMPTVEVNYRANSTSIIRENVIETRLGTISAIASLFEDFKDDIEVLKSMYKRAMVDLTAILHGHSEENDGFIKMNKLNTDMLKYIYKNDWMKITFNPDIPEYYKQQKQYIEQSMKR